MRSGFIFPGTDPELAVELAVLAEQHGWHGFFVWEGIWATDPWATLAAAAVRTSRIRLGTMLTPVPRRRPWELAGQTMTVDRLSGGRLVLSAGLGVAEDAEDRFWIFEHDPGRRVRAELLDESLELLPRLWRGEPFEHEARHYTVRRTEQMLPPTPVQQPGSRSGRSACGRGQIDATGRAARRLVAELRAARRGGRRPRRAAPALHARDRRRGNGLAACRA